LDESSFDEEEVLAVLEAIEQNEGDIQLEHFDWGTFGMEPDFLLSPTTTGLLKEAEKGGLPKVDTKAKPDLPPCPARYPPSQRPEGIEIRSEVLKKSGSMRNNHVADGRGRVPRRRM
jgi:hypothetical protein